jgi:lysophospholipase L1-like esterase
LVLRGFTEETLNIVATTGWRTDNLLNAIAQQPSTQPYTLVSLLIGVNNQYQNRPISQYYAEFPRLLDSAIHLAGGNPDRVFVVSIPDWGITPFGGKGQNKTISEQIDLFNKVKKEETVKKGILFIDITPISRQAINDVSLIAEDGLHPSGKMYQQWVEKISPELSKKIKP